MRLFHRNKTSISILLLFALIGSLLQPVGIRHAAAAPQTIKQYIFMETIVGQEYKTGRYNLWDLLPPDIRNKDGVKIHRVKIQGSQNSHPVLGHGGGDDYMIGIYSKSMLTFNGQYQELEYTSTSGSKYDVQNGYARMYAHVNKEFTNIVLEGDKKFEVYLTGEKLSYYPDIARSSLSVDVEIDFSAPNSPPSIQIQNGGNQTLSNDGTVRIQGTASDPDLNPLTISGEIGGVRKSTAIASGSQWELTWSGQELPEGTHTNIVITADDGAGGQDRATYAGTVLVDKTPPTQPQIQLSNANWTTQPVTVSILPGMDALSGVAKTEYQLTGAVEQAWTAYTGPFSVQTNGTTHIVARTVDHAGNISSATSDVRIDQTAPTAPQLQASKTGWANQDLQVSLVHGEDTQSGVKHSEIRIDGQGWELYSTALQIMKEGVTRVAGRTIDQVGNVGPESSISVQIDRTVPTILISPMERSWSTEDIAVEIKYADELSGVDPNSRKYAVTQSSTPPTNWNTATADVQHLSITDEGQWFVHAKVSDLAGNTAQTATRALQLQHLPTAPAAVRAVNNIEGSYPVIVSWDLPWGIETDGYEYVIENMTDGRSWTVPYPENSIGDADVENGRWYEYRVQVKNHVGQSEYSETAWVLTLPAAPEGLAVNSVERDASAVDFYFDPVRSAERYMIAVGENESGDIVYRNTVTEATYHRIENLQPGLHYTFVAIAENESGEGDESTVGYLSLPAAPGEFETIQIKTDELQLGWSSVTTATYYELERYHAVVHGGPDTLYRDRELVAGTEYDYAVSAKNETGFGSRSTLQKIITLPERVSTVTAATYGTDRITLQWIGVKGAATYGIDIDGKEMATVTAATYGEPMEYTIEGLEPGTLYRMGIQAANRSGAGQSAALQLMTLPESIPASSLSVSDIGETRAIIRWSEVPGADKYRIRLADRAYEVSGTELKLTGLTGGQPYSFTVEAGNASGYGPAASASFLTLPPQVDGIKGAEQNRSLQLTWQPAPSVKWYVIEQGGKEIGRTSATNWMVYGLEPGEEYRFLIRVVNDTGDGKGTPFIWRALPDGMESMVVTVDEIQDTSVRLRWEDVTGTDFYRVYDGDVLLQEEIAVPETILDGLMSSHEYIGLKVVPVNTTGEGKGSAVPSFETLPSGDFNVHVTARPHEITFNFETKSPNETIVVSKDGKEIYRGKDRIFTLDSLPSNTSLKVEVWTENSIEQRSKGQVLELRTLKEPYDSDGSGSVVETWPGTDQNKDVPDKDKLPDPDDKNEPSDDRNVGDGEPDQRNGFDDIDGIYNRNQVLTLWRKGIVKSNAQRKFEPNRAITRAEYMAMIVRALDLDGKEASPMLFKDTEPNAWYFRELRIAHANGIVNGFNIEEFRPNQVITREQAAKMLGNAMNGKTATELLFLDKERIANWAKDEVEALTAAGIIHGYPDGTFRPKLTVNRAEGVEFIFQFIH